MQYNAFNIALGIVILFVFSYSMILLFSYLYLKYLIKNKEVKFAHITLPAVLVSAAWLASLFLSIWFASSVNLIIFAFFALLIFFGLTYGFSEKLYGLSGKHKFIFSIAIAIILNPVWLSMLHIF